MIHAIFFGHIEPVLIFFCEFVWSFIFFDQTYMHQVVWKMKFHRVRAISNRSFPEEYCSAVVLNLQLAERFQSGPRARKEKNPMFLTFTIIFTMVQMLLFLWPVRIFNLCYVAPSPKRLNTAAVVDCWFLKWSSLRRNKRCQTHSGLAHGHPQKNNGWRAHLYTNWR